MTGYLPVVSAASLLAADTPVEQLPSDALLQTWHRLRLAQHSGCISDCPGQPVIPSFRCLSARRNHGVISFVSTSFTIVIIYLTPQPLGEATSVEDRQGYDS